MGLCQISKANSNIQYLLSYICLGYFVCVSVIAEHSAILLVLIIKGGIRDGKIGKGQIREGGCVETFHCLILTKEKCWLTEPPAVALFYYISCGILWRIFCQTGIFRGGAEERL
jgi:hypothetical protein